MRQPVSLAISGIVLVGSAVAGVATAGAAFAADQPAAVCSATDCSVTFTGTGSVQSFTVPSWVTSLSAQVSGAAGGDVTGLLGVTVHSGAQGGRTSGVVPVQAGEVLSVVVGQAGATQASAGGVSAGGYGGGGASGGTGASGGGGGSFVFGPQNALLLAAGGGGGAGSFAAGGSGAGATATAGAGAAGPSNAGGGAAGTDAADGSGGAAANGLGETGAATAGSAGTGAATAATTLPVAGSGGTGAGAGAGGGGGYTAGGGGGGSSLLLGGSTGAGGGGGSGYAAPSVTAVAGSAGVQSGDGSVVFTYPKQPQVVAFTSTAPDTGIIGSTYAVTTTGGDSGNPVVLSLDAATTTGACTLGDDGTVHFAAVGTCVIDANQDGSTSYATADQVQQSIPVREGTSTTVTVQPDALFATVVTLAPATDAPTGTVTFTVDGTSVGHVPLGSDGSASVLYSIPTGASHTVQASYSGDSTHAATVGEYVRKDPTVTVTPSSKKARTRYGWYGTAVTLTYACDAHASTLRNPCPKPVRRAVNEAGQKITRTVTSRDGGSTTVTTVLNIDRVRPTVSLAGVRSGATYRKAPKVTCKASDALSGLASCVVTHQRSGKAGHTMTYTAVATDKAGNHARAVARVTVAG